MKRVLPLVALAAALAVSGATIFATSYARTERRAAAAPPIVTPRLKALWGGAAQAANPAADDENAPEDETPTLNVLTAGALPEEPNRHDLEDAMEKIRTHVDECQALEQFAGTVQVRVVIDRSGSVKSAQAVEPLDETQTGQCVAREVKHATFPRFRGTLTPTIELVYPFYFRPAETTAN
jgi:hypothetical protein